MGISKTKEIIVSDCQRNLSWLFVESRLLNAMGDIPIPLKYGILRKFEDSFAGVTNNLVPAFERTLNGDD